MRPDSEYSYYVLPGQDISSDDLSVQDPGKLPCQMPEGLEFLPIEYPLKILTAVAVHVPPPLIFTGIRAAVVSTDYRGPVLACEGGWVTEMELEFEIGGEAGQSDSDRSSVASIACRSTDLALPNSIAEQAIGKFVTTNRDQLHFQVSCNVLLHLKFWDQVHGWRTCWEKVIEPIFGPLSDNAIDDPFLAKFDAQTEDAFRSNIKMEAKSTGPEVGSFIPCALVDNNSVIEPCCVYEIQNMSSSDEVTSGILHILSPEAPVNIRNLRLLTRCLELDRSLRDSCLLGIIE
ncbi:hypothetical protein [Gimesia sp.]|uniref:hypothetical protein n=1 Tax=Gimesia sp. TaxID=2024833 RepID=UPI0025C16A8C|nr:hypothetical protein [Gimesia sp.]